MENATEDTSGQSPLAMARQVQRQLERAMEVGKVGSWEVDFKKQTLSWSDSVYEIFAIAKDAFGGTEEAFFELIHPEDRDEFLQARAAWLENGGDFLFEHRIVTPAGQVKWVVERARIINDGAGKAAFTVGTVQDVSDLKEAEAGKAAAEQQLLRQAELVRMAGEIGQIGGWRYNVEADYLEWTDETARIHDEPPGTNPTVERGSQYYVPEDRRRVLALLKRCVETSASFDDTFQLVTAAGREITVRTVGTPEHDSSGSVIAVNGALQDITGIVALERQTEQSQKRLIGTLEAMGDAFLLLDRSWRISYLNAKAEGLLEQSRDALLGKNIWDEYPEAVGSMFEAQYRYAVDTGESTEFEEYFAPLARWFRITAYPSAEGLALYFRDVSSERSQSEELRLLSTATDRLNDILLITEAEPIDAPDGPRIVYVNMAFERRTGFSREEVIGQTPRILQGPRTQRAELDRIAEALKNWQPVRAELINYTKSGDAFWIELDIVPLANSEGQFTHWVAVERDITERKALEKQLHQSRKLSALGEMTGGIAHDFNNILSVIIGNAELIEDELRDRLLPGNEGDTGAESLLAFTQQVLGAADRGAELTNRLLAFARRQVLTPIVVNLNETLQAMYSMLQRSLGESVEIAQSWEPGLWLVEVDLAQLETALLNLALNSRDAMPSGGKLTIETYSSIIDAETARVLDLAEGQYAVVAVSDTGTGIDAENLDRVLEPFYSTKEKGTGLGLSMVFGFVRQSGGHVKLYSEPGEGTTVKLFFPASAASVPDSAKAAPVREAPPGRGELVLVVEDDRHVRDNVVAMVRSLNYEVIEAENAAAALDTLERHDDVALLFTDVVMPGGMNGRQLAEVALARYPGLRVLYTSGYTENAIVHHGRLDPGVDLLSKPYRLRELAIKLRLVLDRPNGVAS